MLDADMIRYIVLIEFLIAAGFMLGLMARGPGRRHGAMLYGFGTVCILLLALGAAEVTLRFDHEATWRTFLAFTAGTISVFTIGWINIHERRQERSYPRVKRVRRGNVR